MHDPDQALTTAVRAADEAHAQALVVIASAYDQAVANARRGQLAAIVAADQARNEAYAAAAEAYARALVPGYEPAGLSDCRRAGYDTDCETCRNGNSHV